MDLALATQELPELIIILRRIDDLGLGLAETLLLDAVENLLSLSLLGNGGLGAVPLPDLETSIQDEDITLVKESLDRATSVTRTVFLPLRCKSLGL